MALRDYLNFESVSDFGDYILQNGQAVAIVTMDGVTPLETWYFNESSMAVPNGTTIFKPNDIDIADPGRYIKSMTSSDWNTTLNKPTIPTLTSQLTNDSGFLTSASIPAKVFNTNVSRSLNTNYTVSSTRSSNVRYSINLSVTNPLLAGASTASAFLEYSTDGGTTWKTESQVVNSSSVGVVVAIAITQPNTFELSGNIPANALCRIRTTTTGTASATYVSGSEMYY